MLHLINNISGIKGGSEALEINISSYSAMTDGRQESRFQVTQPLHQFAQKIQSPQRHTLKRNYPDRYPHTGNTWAAASFQTGRRDLRG